MAIWDWVAWSYGRKPLGAVLHRQWNGLHDVCSLLRSVAAGPHRGGARTKTVHSVLGALAGGSEVPFPRVRMPLAHVPPLCFSSAVQIMKTLAKRSAEGDFS